MADASTLPGNKGSTALFNAPVPAPAPTVTPQQVNGQTFVPRGANGAADYSSGAKPVAVISATPATTKINTQVVPALSKANTDIATQNAKLSGIDTNYQKLPGETTSAYNTRVAAYNATKNGTPIPTQTPDATKTDTSTSAEDTIANTPETGHQFAWDANGNRIEIPVGTAAPAGYNTTQPSNPQTKGTAVASSFFDGSGTTYNQYADGTYGKTDASGNFAGAITEADFEGAKSNSPQAALESIKASLASALNGSYPLSPAQSAQINGINASFSALIAQQVQDNANFVGATTVAENLYGMGTSLSGIGQIKGAVDAGVSKIAELQAKQAAAVAQMQTSFDESNMKNLMDAYTVYNDSFKQIQDHIDNMTKFAEQKKVDMQNEKHQNFQDTISSENLTLAKKKEVFDEYVGQANIDHQKKADALDAWYKQQDIALRKQAANPFGDGTGPTPVTLGANGRPSAAGQAAFLASYPQQVQTQIKGLADYSLLPTSFPTRAAKGQMDRATAVALAKQYDPTYDENLAAARQKAKITYTDGTSAPSKSITALNTAAGHLATLAADSTKMGNVGFEPFNYVKNTVGGLTGLNANSGAKLDIGAVTGELAAAFKSSGATDQEIKSLGTIDSNSSPKQVKAYIESATALMGSKLSALDDSYTAAVGAPPASSFLHSTSANDLLKLQDQGYKIDVPQLDTTPPVVLKNFVASNPANSAVYDQAKASIKNVNGGQDPSADDIYQLLQVQGYVQ